MKMLRSRLYDMEVQKRQAETDKLDETKMDISFGSQIRSYVMQPYQMIKDHRTKVEVGDVTACSTAIWILSFALTSWPRKPRVGSTSSPMTTANRNSVYGHQENRHQPVSALRLALPSAHFPPPLYATINRPPMMAKFFRKCVSCMPAIAALAAQ